MKEEIPGLNVISRHLIAPPQYLWLFQTCYIERNLQALPLHIKEAIDGLFLPEWEDPNGLVMKLVSRESIYKELCAYIFQKESNEPLVKILKSKGYFGHGNQDIFKGGVKSPQEYLPLIDTLTWAYCDKFPPREQLQAIRWIRNAGKNTDAEATVCQWINAITSRYKPLTPLNNITRRFMGLPHLRVVLYHFTQERQLLNIEQEPIENAVCAAKALIALNIPVPFDPLVKEQPPMLLLCFLCRMIRALGTAKLKVSVIPVIKRPTIRRSYEKDLTVTLRPRPSSSLTTRKPLEIETNVDATSGRKSKLEANKPKHAQLQPVSPQTLQPQKRKVRWDPNILAMAKASFERNQQMSFAD